MDLERQRTGRVAVYAASLSACISAVALATVGVRALLLDSVPRLSDVRGDTAVCAFVSAAVAIMGALLLLPTAMSPSAYTHRVPLSFVGGVLVPVCLYCTSYIAAGYTAASKGVPLIAVVAATALAIPGCSMLAPQNALHPFRRAAKKAGDPPADSAAKTATHRVGGGVFEDWPEPQPFDAEALYAYQRTSSSELSFRRGDRLVVLDCRGNWWQARHADSGLTGFVPSNYIRVLRRATVRAAADGGGFVARHPDEASVAPGECVEVMEVHEHMSLVRTAATSGARIGSVPTAMLEMHAL